MKLKYVLILFLLFSLTSGCSDANDNTKSLRSLFQNNEAVIYSLNIRTFNAQDTNGNEIIDFDLGEVSGNFINAVDRLDEIKELGINAIHLLPITPVGKIKALGTAGSLYAMSDLTTLNPQLEDNKSNLSIKEQAKYFVDECHKRNIKVIVDLPSCGAYDMFLNHPNLFVTDVDDEAVIPADWTDVRLFNVPNNSTLLKSDIMVLHKIFINHALELGFDGLRADVATLKPLLFWKELIKYTREKNPEFMFLAEASEVWTKPASDKAYFTDYKKLLEAGFDGYYGNYFDLKSWLSMPDLSNSVVNQQKVLKRYAEKKAVIGSFATHDVVSPLLTGGENFSKIIIWLNATLPLNPYYVDGFLQGDDYIYSFSNKPASESYTDDEYYYVHQGQIDIFNFSRKLGSEDNKLINEQKLAITFRNNYSDVITSGVFKPLKTSNSKIFAYSRKCKNKSVIVIINRNLAESQNVKITIPNIKKNSKITFVKEPLSDISIKSTFSANLKPAEIIVFTIEE